MEIFKLFLKDVGVFLLRSRNHGFEKGKMSVTQKQGVIACLPKEGKDKELFENVETNYYAKHALQDCFLLQCTTPKISLYMKTRNDYLGDALLEKILGACMILFFTQVSVMCGAFFSWLTLRRPSTAWLGHLSRSR